jgi:hypothetical protein
MELDALIRRFRLAAKPETRGLRCGPDGLSLAGVSLLRKTADGFALRAPEEVGALMLAAYGEITDGDRLARGLRATAIALNRGDFDLAMVAAVHLRLPDLDAGAASRIAAVEDFLAKYDPNEPRDWRGRWTTGGGGTGVPVAKPSRGRAQSPTNTESAAKPESRWDGVSHPTGGHLVQTGGGSSDDYGNNEPQPWEGQLEPQPPPAINPPKVSEGWDRVEDGAIVRRPTLANGQPWPEADAAVVRRILARGPAGTPPPTMWVYIPLDGKGPDLVGSDRTEEFNQPEGYAKVRFVGTPQVTNSRGAETGHAADSAQEALRLARTNEFETIYFNRGLTMSTRGLYQSLIRPDVVAVARPDLNWEITHFPYESLSPGQDKEGQQERMPTDVPWIAPIEAQRYKRARLRRLEHLGVRLCS